MTNPNNQDTLNDGNAERTTRVSEPDAAITVDRLNLTPQEAEELSVNVRLSDIGQPSDSVKLLPCPFCGGDAELINNSSAASSAYEFDREHIAPKPFHVRCPSAKCGYAPFRSHAKKEKAIQQWNARLYPLPIQCTACHSTEGFAYTDDGRYCGDCHLALNTRKNGVSLETVLAFEAGQEAALNASGEVERLRAKLKDVVAVLHRCEDAWCGGAEDLGLMDDISTLWRQINRLINPPVDQETIIMFDEDKAEGAP